MIIYGEKVRLSVREAKQIAFLCDKTEYAVSRINNRQALVNLLTESLPDNLDNEENEIKGILKIIFINEWLQKIS